MYTDADMKIYQSSIVNEGIKNNIKPFFFFLPKTLHKKSAKCKQTTFI